MKSCGSLNTGSSLTRGLKCTQFLYRINGRKVFTSFHDCILDCMVHGRADSVGVVVTMELFKHLFH